MRNRLITLIITFIAGYFGAHKFYLGQNFSGIMYLVFCWTGIPAILTFFDFLGLLFMSDRDFDRKFNSVSTSALPHSYQPKPSNDSTVFKKQQSSKEIAQTLAELKSLYEQGIITAEEYEVKRRKLLDLI